MIRVQKDVLPIALVRDAVLAGVPKAGKKEAEEGGAR